MKLHQITAILKGIKARLYAEVTALHKEAQKPEPYIGLIKTYRKKDDDGEEFNEPGKKVTLTAPDVLKKLAKLSIETFDTTAQQEWANTKAKADVVVDGQTLLTQVPVTYLLFIEKQTIDIRTFVDKMPTLDESRDWTQDPNGNLYRTSPASSHKTKKVQRAIVKYDATKEHPAQTEMITEDVIIGWWDTTHLSGALPIPRKELLLERIDKLLKAVKIAREMANDQEVSNHEVGEKVFGYLLAS